jgi:chromosome segregation ATPase
MSGGNLNDWESKVSVLERNNFDLKMQVYYLNEKLANNLSDTTTGDEEDEFHEYEYGKRSAELLTLTEENSQYKRRVIELESELLQLRLQQQKESARYEAALRAQPTTMEEAQKREREAAFAIAEHDAILIHKLEVRPLQSPLHSIVLLVLNPTFPRSPSDGDGAASEAASARQAAHRAAGGRVAKQE